MHNPRGLQVGRHNAERMTLRCPSGACTGSISSLQQYAPSVAHPELLWGHSTVNYGAHSFLAVWAGFFHRAPWAELLEAPGEACGLGASPGLARAHLQATTRREYHLTWVTGRVCAAVVYSSGLSLPRDPAVSGLFIRTH